MIVRARLCHAVLPTGAHITCHCFCVSLDSSHTRSLLRRAELCSDPLQEGGLQPCPAPCARRPQSAPPTRLPLPRAAHPRCGRGRGGQARSPSSPPRLGQPDWAAFATRKDEGRTRSSQLGSVWPLSGAVPRGPLTSSVQGRCPGTAFWNQVTYDPRPTLLGLPVLRDRPPHGPCGLSPAKNTSRKSGGPDAHVWGPPPSGHRRSPWKRTLKALSLL